VAELAEPNPFVGSSSCPTDHGSMCAASTAVRPSGLKIRMPQIAQR
jgi:hypothetical protein